MKTPTVKSPSPESAAPPAEPMHIVALEASNFKRLRAIRITPTGEMVEITGKNAQGKSSTLDAIMAALAGGFSLPDKPIRRGHKEAEIRVKIGGKGDDLTVTRRFTQSGSTLTVTAADGSKLGSPQAVLDRLLGTLAFDPLAFTQMEPRQQVGVLKSIAGLNEAFDSIEQERQKAQVALTTARGEEKRAALSLESCPMVDGPDVEVSMLELADEMSAATATIEQHRKARAWLDGARVRVAGIAAEIAQLESRIKELADTGKTIQSQIDDNEPKVLGFVDPDVAAIKSKMATIEGSNTAARKRHQHRAAVEARRLANEALSRASREVDDVTARREELLTSAKLPVPGLGFTEDGVTLNGMPFEQASQAEQIRASFGMAMAQNPTLRVALIRQGSLLDRDGLRMLAEIACQHQAQVWVERVTNGEQVGIVIEDGEVRQGGGE